MSAHVTGNRNIAVGLGLLFAVLLWGGNNAGTKYIVGTWPPLWTGSSRFILAGLLLMMVTRLTPAFGENKPISKAANLRLWLRGGLSLAIYIAAFNWALRETAASHVALYLGASPVWALLWEGWPSSARVAARRYVAAGIALTGVVVLFWPSLRHSRGTLPGEALGLAASVLWTNYGRQCKKLSGEVSPVQISAYSMWQAGVLLLPLALPEIFSQGLQWRWQVGAVQLYCITLGSVVTFAIWTYALKVWNTSQVLLFNNLIPLSTMSWAALCLGERITGTFWIAMGLVLGGVLLGQANWLDSLRLAPPE